MTIFLSVSDQWRIIVTPGGVIRQSIEMTAIAAAMEMFEVKDKIKRLREIKLIQNGALKLLNQ